MRSYVVRAILVLSCLLEMCFARIVGWDGISGELGQREDLQEVSLPFGTGNEGGSWIWSRIFRCCEDQSKDNSSWECLGRGVDL